MTGVDAGTRFGTWEDETSRLLYSEAMPALLCGTDTTGWTLDLGGGTGIAREWFPNLTTVDSDHWKEPDVLADITTYVPAQSYDRVLLRYVLHYLDDRAARGLFAHLAQWHHGEVTVVQFVNDDLAAKQANSVNESKHFRTEDQLRALFGPWTPVHRVAVSYDVVPDFYRNRLHHPDPFGHPETVVAYDLKVTP